MFLIDLVKILNKSGFVTNLKKNAKR